MNYVIGSGPTGASAASALVNQGLPVTMLDAGGEIEPEKQQTVDHLGGLFPENWHAEELQAIRGALQYTAEGAPRKLRFGSDYPYRDPGGFQPTRNHRVEAYPSFALGGLSVLWGASILPYTTDDLTGWPITSDELKPHYEAVLRLTGLSAEHDELEALYPLFIEPTARLGLSQQASALMERLRENAAELGRQQIHFGKARLAISPSKGIVSGCVHCGLCLYGCPYDLIYSSRATVRALMADKKNFTYIPDYVVHSLVERNGAVEINALFMRTGETRVFESSRVYLAAGVYSSTRILLESMQAYDHPVILRQSDNFLLPVALAASPLPVSIERLHTLSQVFIELLDRSLSRHAVHLQIYTHNDLYARMAKDKLGFLYPALAPLLNKVIERLALIRGYIHSDDSSTIRATLRRPGSDSSRSVLHLDAVSHPGSRKLIRGVARLLSRNRRRTGARPIGFGMRLGLPGSGAHVGGSFPMSHTPREFETDRIGRPSGYQRVHVVDSTVFTTVPAATITLTAMANAHRIASIREADIPGYRQ